MNENAHMKSWNKGKRMEMCHHHFFSDDDALCREVHLYAEFHNAERPHPSLGYPWSIESEAKERLVECPYRNWQTSASF